LSAAERTRAGRACRERNDVVQRIGVTGHVNVSNDVAQWVTTALTQRLGGVLDPPVHGVTCLAAGADQIFAKVILALSGTLEVVLPAGDYSRSMAETEGGATFKELLRQASSVEIMPFETSSRDAYLAASQAMLSRCNLLLAVWDGAPSRRVGDTAHVVEKAQERDLPVEVFWPPTPAGAPGRD
jgi:hypothetical protein